MILGFIVCLVFFLGFRAIGRSNEKRSPVDTMGEMMKEDGKYIRGIIIIVGLICLVLGMF